MRINDSAVSPVNFKRDIDRNFGIPVGLAVAGVTPFIAGGLRNSGGDSFVGNPFENPFRNPIYTPSPYAFPSLQDKYGQASNLKKMALGETTVNKNLFVRWMEKLFAPENIKMTFKR